MKKNRILLIIVLVGVIFQLPAQIKVDEPLKKGLMEATPGEQMFVHLSSELLFPGEYLLYKVYVLDQPGEGLSSVSKIAYVELLGEDGNQVFLQKIALQDGMGQADYFVPTSITSGNYKLVAYTNWMRNAEEHFFEEDIVIINPYQADQNDLLNAADTISPPIKRDLPANRNSSNLEVSPGKQNYGNREKVTIELNNLPDKESGADLSVSVRKVTDLPGISTKGSNKQEYNATDGEGRIALYLPEMRGELFTGRIIPASRDKNLPLKDQHIVLSIPGEEILPKISATDASGRFFFNLDTKRQKEEAFVEILGEGKDNYIIEVDQTSGINAASLNFREFHLTPEMEQEIIRRSVYNQIENAYFGVKPDTLVTVEANENFMGSMITSYDLDAYKRFKTVPETFVEIVKSAWIRKSREGKQVFQVRPLDYSLGMNQLPLVVIDGVNIQDHEELINIPANRIKSIEIVRDKLYIGPEIFQGAVLVNTFEGNYYNNASKPYGKKLEITRPEIQQRYFKQEYKDLEERERIPDFRYQLFWEPDLRIGREGKKIEFYTSDVDGDFEVIIRGFSDNGEPIDVRQNFSVR